MKKNYLPTDYYIENYKVKNNETKINIIEEDNEIIESY